MRLDVGGSDKGGHAMTDLNYVIVNVLILTANIGILGLCLKLYTEYFKDVSQRGEKP